MILLLFNWELYVYDFRIVRYASFFLAIVFNILYILMAGSAADLIFVKGKWDDTDNFYDIFWALLLGYCSVLYVPTFHTNLMIFLKELTMN